MKPFKTYIKKRRYRTLPTVTDRYRILPLLALQALPALH